MMDSRLTSVLLIVVRFVHMEMSLIPPVLAFLLIDVHLTLLPACKLSLVLEMHGRDLT